MRSHLLTPEQALIKKQWDDINRWAWTFRRATGGQLRLALLTFVPEELREDVAERVKFIQNKHKIKGE